MPLDQLNLPDVLPSAPPEVERFIADARSRIDSFLESRLEEQIHSFVPSDFPLVYGALRYVADAHLAAGSLFCEWGSGAGVVTCLAAIAGFDACGIEFEADLVELSTRLAGSYRLNVGIYHGNLVPHDGQKIAEETGEFEWLAVGGADPYSQMDRQIDDFDLIFAYPWPGEQRVIERLFDRFAFNGALLMTYNGTEGIRLLRKRSTKENRS